MEDQSSHKGFLTLVLLVLAVVGAGWAYMVSDEDRLATLEKGADAIFDRLLSA